jgi:hypothetical protein
MSFLFGKSKKSQNTGLPAATRNITSSHGQGSSIPVANGSFNGADEKARGQVNTPTPGGSANNSLNSLQGGIGGAAPEPKTLRERSASDVYVSSSAGLYVLHLETLRIS